MRAAFIERYGDNGVVRVGERPEPSLGEHDVLVEVHAASINPVDFKIRAGKLRQVLRMPLPFVLGNDLSGVVRSVGAGVKAFAPGDEVFGRLEKSRMGAWAELCAVNEKCLAKKPRAYSHAQAAAVTLTGLTAWQAMVEIAGATSGQRALIHAGAGGVGTFAIQLARHRGLYVATTASKKNEGFLRELGADEVIDYNTQRFDDVLRDIDFALEGFGGEIRERTFRVMRRGGTLVSIEGLPDVKFAREQKLNPLLIPVIALANMGTNRRAKKHRVRYAYLFMRPDGAQLAEIAALADAGVIKSIVDRTYPLDQAAEALSAVEQGKVRGKIVLQVR